MKITILAAPMLMALAHANEVTFYRGRDCNPNDKIDYLEAGDNDSGLGSNPWAYFDDIKPVSMKMTGWGNVILKQDQTECAYCANYYTLGHNTVDDGCFADDRQKCVNIDTGFGPDSALLMSTGNGPVTDPADIPCRNFQKVCKFPTPPGNGFCDQGS